jgi:hypothetical protein
MPTLGLARYSLLAALLIAAGQPVLAATDDDEEEQEPWDARWAVAIVAEVDQQSNRGIAGEVGYAWTPSTSVRLAGNSIAYSEVPGNGFRAQGVELGASHDFKRFALSGAVARWQDSDFLTAEELKLGADLRQKPWFAGLSAMLRRSGFDVVNVNSSITLLDGTLLPVQAPASCKMLNDGIGVHGGYAGDVWGLHGDVRGYQYRTPTCSFGKVVGLEVLDHPTKNEFVQLLAPLVTQLSTVGVRRIGSDNVLLSSALDGGASWKHEDFIVRLDYARQREYLGGMTSNTVFATGTADMGHNSGVDLVIGLTRGRTVSSGGFVGFAVRAHF